MGKPTASGYYWHGDHVVHVVVGMPSIPDERTYDGTGSTLHTLCWRQIEAGQVVLRRVVDDGMWSERIERPPPPDSATGEDRAPTRYTAKRGRESIDTMRDLAHYLFGDPDLADMVFAYHCAADALKYADREGLKGSADTDRRKHSWYGGMTEHALGHGPDPRSTRETFTPWTWQPLPPGLLRDTPHLSMLMAAADRRGGAGGLFLVGFGPPPKPTVASTLSRRELTQLLGVAPGDVVEVLLEDGRIARTTASSRMTDAVVYGFRQPSFRLDGIRAKYPADRVRLPGKWRAADGFTYHDHVGLDGQRVPFTCPVMREILALLRGAGLGEVTEQRIVGRLELLRAYNAQLRRNQRRSKVARGAAPG